MTRPTRKPWADRAPVEAVTHEPEPSGLAEAWAMLAADGPVSLDALARESMLPWHIGPSGATRTVAAALRQVQPDAVALGGVCLVVRSGRYCWPEGFVPDVAAWRRPLMRGEAAALAVGVALWGRLPTADEVAAWVDEPAGEEVG